MNSNNILPTIIHKGTIYIVPTPIGNLSDITYRAISILSQVNIIAAENIIHTLVLLKNFKIKNFIISLNQFNEVKKIPFLIKQLTLGKTIALVSNAGTPIINDPGYLLIKKCQEKKIKIVPLPGPCSIITALIASGLPANQFSFEGFFPIKNKTKIKVLQLSKTSPKTRIFFESAHRIIYTIEDIINELGKNHKIALAKELTKIWELIYYSEAIKILSFLKTKKENCKGEFIILISGKTTKTENINLKTINTLNILKNVLPIKTAILLTSKIHQEKKNLIYNYAIKKFKNDKI